MIIGGKILVNALDSFLQTSSGATKSLNDVVKAYRTQTGLTSAELPDVATFGKFAYLGSQVVGATPYVASVWTGSEEETANNSRIVPHRLSIFMLLVEGDVGGNEETLVERALDYSACMRSMLLRATTPGAYGRTLNNGGTGDAQGRIHRADIVSSETLDDLGINAANVVIRWDLRVEVIEDYPGV